MEEDLVECEAKVSQLSLINKIAADFVIINYFKPLRRHHIISIARQLKYTVAKDPIYLLIKSIWLVSRIFSTAADARFPICCLHQHPCHQFVGNLKPALYGPTASVPPFALLSSSWKVYTQWCVIFSALRIHRKTQIHPSGLHTVKKWTYLVLTIIDKNINVITYKSRRRIEIFLSTLMDGQRRRWKLLWTRVLDMPTRFIEF